MKSIHENLMVLGVPRATALVVEALSDEKPHTMHEIERISDLRQPEVSIAVGLIGAYIKSENRSNGCVRGRPEKVVTMTRRDLYDYVELCLKSHKVALECAEDVARELIGR